MPENRTTPEKENRGNQATQTQNPARTGPSTGNTRGNDLPSAGETKKDTRSAQGTQTERQGQQPGRDTEDEDRDGNPESGTPGRSGDSAARMKDGKGSGGCGCG